MNTASDVAGAAKGIHRDAVTWYAYLALSYFTYIVSIQGNIIPFLQADLDLNYAEVSLHTSAIAVGILIVGLFGDRLVVVWGRRRVLSASTLGSAAGAILLCLAPAAWASIGACLIIGLFGAFIPGFVPAILADIHGSRREIAFAESNALCYVFAATAPLLAALAAWQGWNWRLGLAVGALTGIAIALAYFRTTVPDNQVTRESSAARLPPAYWAYWAMLFCAVALEFAALLWAPAYLEKVIGLSAAGAAIAAGVFFAAMLIGRTFGIRLVRRFAARQLFLGAIATTGVGFVAYWGSGVPAVVIPGLFVIGLGIAMLFPLILGFAMGAAGDAGSDRAASRVIVAPGLAILFTPPLLGYVADHAGLRVSQIMIPVFALLAVVAFLAAQALARAKPA